MELRKALAIMVCHDDQEASHNSLTSCEAPLSLAYFAVAVLLQRAMMWPMSEASKSDSTSPLRRHFGEALGLAAEFVAYVERVDDVALHGCWGARKLIDCQTVARLS